MLAAMPAELRPLVRRLGLHAIPGSRGRTFGGDVDAYAGTRLLAVLTGIGPSAATTATAHFLDTESVDMLFVIGIAGGVGRGAQIGDLVVPAVVADGTSGAQFRPQPAPGLEPRGRLLTTDKLVVDSAELSRLAAAGTTALDMETAAVAAVCERVGCPWSVIRAVSDRAGRDGVDDAILGLAAADGSADLRAVARYVVTRPWRLPRLARLARGMHAGAHTAVRTFVEVLARLCESGTEEDESV